MTRRSRGERIRKGVRDGLLVLAISIGLFAVLEGALRAFAPQHLDGTPIVSDSFAERDELLGRRYVPLAHWRFTHPEYTVEYAINEHGYRDERDHPVPKPEGRTRVLVLGDSFTFGEGVDYEDVWTVRAERRLEELGRTDIELVKLGLQGADQRSQLILLERLLDSLEGDVVIIVFLINDLYTNVPYDPVASPERDGSDDPWHTAHFAADPDPTWEEMRERVFSPSRLPTRLHLVTLARRILISSDAAYNRLYIQAPGRGEFLSPRLGPEPRRQLEITERLFEQIAEHCRERGVELIVLSLPQQFQALYYEGSQDDDDIDVARYDRHFAEVAAREGFTWIPFLEGFAASPHPASDLFHRLDGHFTALGNEVAADIFMREVFPLLEGASAATEP